MEPEAGRPSRSPLRMPVQTALTVAWQVTVADDFGRALWLAAAAGDYDRALRPVSKRQVTLAGYVLLLLAHSTPTSGRAHRTVYPPPLCVHYLPLPLSQSTSTALSNAVVNTPHTHLAPARSSPHSVRAWPEVPLLFGGLAAILPGLLQLEGDGTCGPMPCKQNARTMSPIRLKQPCCHPPWPAAAGREWHLQAHVPCNAS